MSDLSRIIAIIFNVFFILTLFGFIFKIVTQIRKEPDTEIREENDLTEEWGLEVVRPGVNTRLKAGEVYSLMEGLTLGRQPDNDIMMDDPFVSFHHARFFVRKGRYVIEDLESTNGTRLNDERLTQKTYLRLEDLIEIGSAVFRVIR